MERVIVVLRPEDQLAFALLGQAILTIDFLLVCPIEADEVQCRVLELHAYVLAADTSL